MREPYQVLLFEDTADDEALALRALKTSGAPLEVRVARDGREALEVLGISNGQAEGEVYVPDLVISDLKMPKLTGAEVLARVRRDARFAEVPFVIFSSSDEPNDVDSCIKLGASAYCAKPVDYTSFIECVREIAKRWLLDSGGDKADVDCILEVGSGT